MTGMGVTLSAVGKRFSDDVWTLRGVSEDVGPGEIVSVLGKSGIGKSTLLRIIAGLESADEGSVLVGGQVTNQPHEALGYLVQDYSHSLFPWLSVAGNLRMGLHASALGKKERDHKIREALAQVGLSGNEKKYPWQLSGGMQQRVALARAIIRRPKLLLLDEPFASVDSFVRMELEDLTRSILREHNITAIIVTHDIDEAIYMADRVVTLSGFPARVSSSIKVSLPEQRDQESTRNLPEFPLLRNKILLQLV